LFLLSLTIDIIVTGEFREVSEGFKRLQN